MAAVPRDTETAPPCHRDVEMPPPACHGAQEVGSPGASQLVPEQCLELPGIGSSRCGVEEGLVCGPGSPGGASEGLPGRS